MKETYESIFLKYKLHFDFLNNINGIRIIFSINPPLFCYINNEGIIEPQCYLKCFDGEEIRTENIDNYLEPFEESFNQLLERIITFKEFNLLCQKEKIKKI